MIILTEREERLGAALAARTGTIALREAIMAARRRGIEGISATVSNGLFDVVITKFAGRQCTVSQLAGQLTQDTAVKFIDTLEAGYAQD